MTRATGDVLAMGIDVLLLLGLVELVLLLWCVLWWRKQTRAMTALLELIEIMAEHERMLQVQLAELRVDE